MPKKKGTIVPASLRITFACLICTCMTNNGSPFCGVVLCMGADTMHFIPRHGWRRGAVPSFCNGGLSSLLWSLALARFPRWRRGVSARRKRLRLVLLYSSPDLLDRPSDKGQLISLLEIFWLGAHSNLRAVPKVHSLLIATYISTHNVDYRAALPHVVHLR